MGEKLVTETDIKKNENEVMKNQNDWLTQTIDELKNEIERKTNEYLDQHKKDETEILLIANKERDISDH